MKCIAITKAVVAGTEPILVGVPYFIYSNFMHRILLGIVEAFCALSFMFIASPTTKLTDIAKCE